MTMEARASTLVRRPANAVFDAFADAQNMSAFWFHRNDNGLKAGESVRWYVGAEPEAPSIEVRVIAVEPGKRIAIEWSGPDERSTEVEWTFAEREDGHTVLTIREGGFSGSEDEVLARVLDSTGGFNQVVVAAKAFAEHGVAMNLVQDHA